jgi:cellulose synthase (UDP-forming)
MAGLEGDHEEVGTTTSPSAPASRVIVVRGPVCGGGPEAAADGPAAAGGGQQFLASAVPEIRPGRELLIRITAVVALVVATFWIYYRWTQTLNPDAIVFSVVLAIAETYAVMGMYLLVFTGWRLKVRTPPPAPEGLTVDVFITNYDEPLDVVRRTAMGAKCIRYPHRTWLLDDGKRDDVLELARELEVGYIRREGNEHAKAGNLNHALSVTDGEFVLQLDADHVPLPNMLDRMLGYFNDPNLAFVQSPQDFYNTDSFTHVVNDSGRRLWEENRIFFSLIQPGKDRCNSAFFCGSCGILRRSALEQIGGFSTRTITEDMETSMVLHGRGWNSAYHGETLAYGLAPASAGAYHVQRLRWGQGSMQILRRMNPLTYPGLTLAQRLQYFASVITYLDGFQKLVFYVAPLMFLLFGVLPVSADPGTFLVLLAVYMTVTLVSFELLSRGTGYILIGERFNMAKFFTYMVSVSGYFARGKLKFNVTPKGATDVPFRTYAPQLVLFVISVGSLPWAILAREYGWVDYAVQGWGSSAFLVSGFWAVWNAFFAGYIVRHSLIQKQQREDHRFVDSFPITLKAVDGDRHIRLHAVTLNLNPQGMAFRSTGQLEPGLRVSTRLPLSTGVVQVYGTVQHIRTEKRGRQLVHVHGVEFGDLPPGTRDDIEMHCTHHAVPLWRLRYTQSVQILDRAVELLRKNTRHGRRRRVGLPATVQVRDAETGKLRQTVVLLEEAGAGGVRLLAEELFAPGSLVSYEVPGTAVNGVGRVVFVRMLESPIAARYVIGLSTEAAAEPPPAESVGAEQAA